MRNHERAGLQLVAGTRGATISTDVRASGAVLVIAGDLDVRSTGEVRAALEDHLRVHGSYTGGRIVVDISGVTSVDETALKVLAVASRRARRRGGAVLLRGACPAVRRMLHLTHLIRLVDLERDPVPA